MHVVLGNDLSDGPYPGSSPSPVVTSSPAIGQVGVEAKIHHTHLVSIPVLINLISTGADSHLYFHLCYSGCLRAGPNSCEAMVAVGAIGNLVCLGGSGDQLRVLPLIEGSYSISIAT